MRAEGSLCTCVTEDLLARAGTDPEVEGQLISRMRSLLAPFVLRRLKTELAEQMVTKNHKLHEVCMLGRLTVSFVTFIISFSMAPCGSTLQDVWYSVPLLLCAK